MPPAAGPTVGFDLDLTLVDSSAGIAATLRAALSEVGRSVSDEQVWPLIGLGLQRIVTTLAPGVDADAVARRYRALYSSTGVDSVRLLPGAGEALAAVHEAGGRVLVVSAKVEPAIRAVLAKVGLDRSPWQPDVVAGGRFGAAKGGVLREHGAQAYVGDHPGDIEAARAGGTVAVAVCTGSHAAGQLRAAGADAVLDDLSQFPTWLRRWWRARGFPGAYTDTG